MDRPFCAEERDARRGVAKDIMALDKDAGARSCDETFSREDLQESGLSG